jgi:hypothetical protein
MHGCMHHAWNWGNVSPFTDAMRWMNLEWMDLAGGIGMHGSIIHGMAVARG